MYAGRREKDTLVADKGRDVSERSGGGDGGAQSKSGLMPAASRHADAVSDKACTAMVRELTAAYIPHTLVA